MDFDSDDSNKHGFGMGGVGIDDADKNKVFKHNKPIPMFKTILFIDGKHFALVIEKRFVLVRFRED